VREIVNGEVVEKKLADALKVTPIVLEKDVSWVTITWFEPALLVHRVPLIVVEQVVLVIVNWLGSVIAIAKREGSAGDTVKEFVMLRVSVDAESKTS
jgi:hypothetical protein